jgi:GNAT superfamily N-acetyltransferase
VGVVTQTPFRPRALGELLELWHRVMPQDAPGPERFRDIVLLDPAFRPDGLVMAWRGRRLIGFGYAVAPEGAPGTAPPRGWLVALGVAPEEQRRGHGRRLLRACLGFLAGAGCSVAELGGNGERYLLPGADPVAYPSACRLLQAAGFRRAGSTRAMSCELGPALAAGPGPDSGAAVAGPRYEYRHPGDGDIPELLRAAAAISPSWRGLIRDYLAREADPGNIWIAADGDGIAGFAGADLFPGCPGRFGPMGVLPAARGGGVGSRLLRLTLGSMAERGHRRAWFLWGPEGAAGRRMYASAGFRVSREFEFFSRDLQATRERKAG